MDNIELSKLDRTLTLAKQYNELISYLYWR